jgi:glycosyltransferase involved in cell wall biosynthesis
VRFSLVFVGGNSWNSAAFEAQVKSLQAANRPVQTILGLTDDLLWAAYRLAYCTVFASLHEGFGLPVAESLASGTPVITSNFGSMREIARQGGALLVDPRNDRSLSGALRHMLSDRPLRDRLAAEAATIPFRSWDDYAAEVWAYLVEGTAPPLTWPSDQG